MPSLSEERQQCCNTWLDLVARLGHWSWASWRAAERWIGRSSMLLAGVIAIAGLVLWLRRRRQASARRRGGRRRAPPLHFEVLPR